MACTMTVNKAVEAKLKEMRDKRKRIAQDLRKVRNTIRALDGQYGWRNSFAKKTVYDLYGYESWEDLLYNNLKPLPHLLQERIGLLQDQIYNLDSKYPGDEHEQDQQIRLLTAAQHGYALVARMVVETEGFHNASYAAAPDGDEM